MISINELAELAMEKGPAIGAFRNDWRNRRVTIFAHPTDPTRVITRGQSLDNSAPDIWTDELREDFKPWIGSFGKVYR